MPYRDKQHVHRGAYNDTRLFDKQLDNHIRPRAREHAFRVQRQYVRRGYRQ